MKFEEMLRYIQNFCRKANISEELVIEIYHQKLFQYMKENALSSITISQLSLIEKYCPGFKKSLKNRIYSNQKERKDLIAIRDSLEDRWIELNDKYNKIIRENEIEVAKGLFYGITTLPKSGDEKYDLFKRFLNTQIKKQEPLKGKIKYYLTTDTVNFFNMFFSEYMERLKSEKIPSAEEYDNYLQERENLEIEIANVERQIGEIPEKGMLISFEMNGMTVQVNYG